MNEKNSDYKGVEITDWVAFLNDAEKPENKSNKYFKGNSLDVKNKEFSNPIRFINCYFDVAVDLSSCEFKKGLEFIGCIFNKKFNMIAANVTGDFGFRACTFNEEANFDRLKVDGKFDIRAPSDKKALQGNKVISRNKFTHQSGRIRMSHLGGCD